MMYNNGGRPRYMGEMPGQNQSESHGERETAGENTRDPQSANHSTEGYVVVTPNLQKRNHIIQQAQRGEQSYQSYKEQRKLGSVNCSGVLGGGHVSMVDSRKDSQSALRRANIERRQREQERKEAEKRREQEEFDKKKAEQRRKAEQNRSREQQREENLRLEQIQNREQWLSKLESRNNGASAKGRSETSDSSVMEFEESEESQRRYVVSDSTIQKRLMVLVRAFPQYGRSHLHELLQQCNGSADTVIDVLE